MAAPRFNAASPVPAQIYHLVLIDEFEAASASGRYDRSTRGVSLAEQGFIHASADVEQVRTVYGFAYADLPADAVGLVTIDTSALAEHAISAVFEPGDPSSPAGEHFVHLYGGPLPVELMRPVSLSQVLGPESAQQS